MVNQINSKRRKMKKAILLSIVLLSVCYSQAYDYSLVDINTSSSTYGETISPDYFQGQVTLHYFGHQN
jgi:hypothetical protein